MVDTSVFLQAPEKLLLMAPEMSIKFKNTINDVWRTEP